MTETLEHVADYEIRRKMQMLQDTSDDGYVLMVFVGGQFEMTMTFQEQEIRSTDESLLRALEGLHEQIRNPA